MNAGYVVMSYQKRISAIKKDEITDQDKLDVLKSFLRPKKYIDFKKKQELIKTLIKNTMADDSIGDSATRYFEFVNMILNQYFDLDIDDSTFDKLASYDILGLMMVMIQNEYEMMQMLLDSYLEDIKNGNLKLESL